jgi:hypothetical protein
MMQQRLRQELEAAGQQPRRSLLQLHRDQQPAEPLQPAPAAQRLLLHLAQQLGRQVAAATRAGAVARRG